MAIRNDYNGQKQTWRLEASTPVSNKLNDRNKNDGQKQTWRLQANMAVRKKPIWRLEKNVVERSDSMVSKEFLTIRHEAKKTIWSYFVPVLLPILYLTI